MSVAIQNNYFYTHDTYNDKENNSFYANDLNRKRASSKKNQRMAAATKPIVRNMIQNALIYQDLEASQTKPSIIIHEVSNPLVLKKLNASKVKKSLTFDKNSGNLKRQLFVERDSQQNTKGSNSGLLRNGAKDKMVPDIVKASGILGVPKVETVQEIKNESTKMEIFQESDSKKETRLFVEELLHQNMKIRANEAKEVKQNRKAPNMMKVYASDIIKTLKEKDREMRPVHSLMNHSIQPSLRAKMVDWMIEVMCSYKCSDQAFFLAVNIMDTYFYKSEGFQDANDLHLVGVTSMLMASKFEEIYPMRVNTVHEKIAHKKFSVDEIVSKEAEIFRVLGYNLVSATIHEFIINVIFQLKINQIVDPELFEYLQRVCLYFAKANMFDYDLLTEYNHCELAASTLFVAFKVLEQVENEFPVRNLVDKVHEILGVDDAVLYPCSTKILTLMKNFEKIYPNLKNLKQFHSVLIPRKNSTSLNNEDNTL